MGKTIRNYDRDGLKGMKVVKKSKPRKKYSHAEDIVDDEYDSIDDNNNNDDDSVPNIY